MGTRKHAFWWSLTLVASAVGCGGAQRGVPAEAPAPAASAAPAAGAGLDAELVGLASRAQGVMKIKMRVGPDGTVHKLAVYHHDAAAIPEPVRALAAERFPGAETLYYESELYSDLGRAYEVEIRTAEGKECEVSASADGTLLYEECKVPPDQIDPKVKATVDRLVPGGTVLEVETKHGPDRDEVSVEVKAGDVEHYVRTTPDGELIGHTLRIPAIIEVPVP